MSAQAVAVDFQRANLHARLRRITEADIRGQASATEAAWLREPGNLVNWLRVLRLIRYEFETHTAKQKRALPPKPVLGGHASREYVEAKREFDAHHARRLHFLQFVNARQEEAVTLLAEHGLTPHSLGTVIDALVHLETILDEGDTDGAHDYLTQLIDRYERDEV